MADYDLDSTRAAETLDGGWRRCPTCGYRFRPSDRRAWDGKRHKRCGQRLDLAAPGVAPPPSTYPKRHVSARAVRPLPLFLGTAGVRGSSVAWPSACTCCGDDPTTYKEVVRTFKDSDLHAPVERIVTVTTTARIPVCRPCLTHIRASESFDSGMMMGWLGVATASIALFLLLLRFRGEVASLFGLPARQAFIPGIIIVLGFMIGAMTVVWRIMQGQLRKAKDLGPSCTHPDGGVRFTGFVAPTEIHPTLVETRHFTFRRESTFQAFLRANGRNVFVAPKPDSWDTP